MAVFDSDEAKIGTEVAGRRVRPMRAMKPYITRHGIRLAVLTTPVSVSQSIVDRLVPLGVEAIWNFTPTQLTVPGGVLVRNEHIAIGLCELTYHLKDEGEGGIGSACSA